MTDAAEFWHRTKSGTWKQCPDQNDRCHLKQHELRQPAMTNAAEKKACGCGHHATVAALEREVADISTAATALQAEMDLWIFPHHGPDFRAQREALRQVLAKRDEREEKK